MWFHPASIWLVVIILGFVLAQTTEINIVTSVEDDWDSLTGSIVSTSAPFSNENVLIILSSSSACDSSTSVPLPDATYGSDMQESRTQSAHIGSPTVTFGMPSVVIRCDIFPETALASCERTTVILWSGGGQIWTSTLTSTTPYPESETHPAMLEIGGGLGDLRDSTQSPPSTTTAILTTSTSGTSLLGSHLSNTSPGPTPPSLKQRESPDDNRFQDPTTNPISTESDLWETHDIVSMVLIFGFFIFFSLGVIYWHSRQWQVSIEDIESIPRGAEANPREAEANPREAESPSTHDRPPCGEDTEELPTYEEATRQSSSSIQVVDLGLSGVEDARESV